MNDLKNKSNNYLDLPSLSEEAAVKRLEEEGFNELPSEARRGVLSIALQVVKEPMFLLLIACGLVYFLLGDFGEAMVLVFSIFVIIGITLFQERKTERALDALKALSSPRALVLRDGSVRRISGREVVRGDIVILSEGDRVPADGILLLAENLNVDESLLTGESVPARKCVWDGILEMSRPGGDDLPFVYSGTLVTAGKGIVQVKAIGIKTEMGKIGKSLETLVIEPTYLEKETRKIAKKLAISAILLCILVAVVYFLVYRDLLKGALSGLALAMSLLPEEIPVILTVFLALGAWRLSKQKVLTRRFPVIETLGATSVLCVDKTGTITMNQMSVEKIYNNKNFFDATKNLPLPEEFNELIEFSVMASEKNPFDPMEKAIKSFGKKTLKKTKYLNNDWKMFREYPLANHFFSISRAWLSPENDKYIISAQGAPEAIISLCHIVGGEKRKILDQVDLMAKKGLRMLGVAKANFVKKDLPDNQQDFDFEFLGLVGLKDPVRPDVREAVKECFDAGIRLIMITGDYAGTARRVAEEIGLLNLTEIITGDELDEMDDKKLQERIKTVNIFARVVPEQKLRIVNALKANNEVVAMTGDGVNDAPALKAAHVGIAMGERGTDVARETASLVLLNDDFNSIVEAIRYGRNIILNIKKAIFYVFTTHVPIAGMSLLPLVFKWPLLFYPVHIVFLELITDPACSVVFEGEPPEKDFMKNRPRKLKESLLDKKTIKLSLLQGFSMLVVIFVVYWFALQIRGENLARSIAFVAFVIANLGLILSNRSWLHNIFVSFKIRNPSVKFLVPSILILLLFLIYVPFAQKLFYFEGLGFYEIVISAVGGILSILFFEIFKALKIKKIE
ncbi:MAG: cation-translocating P-type ATPase [Patescibacteria group bacterium]|nr:cation-translocating P-type ATPase [Patescibacteria group bacterium]